MKMVMSRKKIIAVSSAAALIVALLAVSCIFAFGKKDKSYRSVKIVEIEGSVTVEREGTGSLTASVNMNLVSGDYLATSEDAYVVLRLDEDKYVMLGECGAMKVTAQGGSTAGKTSIQLDSGSVLSEIQNPLGKDSTFDIVTPNATMSVRGTVFEVCRNTGNGEGTVLVKVYDGCVAVGAAGMEQKLYNAGEFTEFTDTASPKFLTEKGTITGEQINSQVLKRLLKIQEQGRNLNMDNILPVSGGNVLPAPTKPVQEETKPVSTQKAQEETKPVPTQKAQEETRPAVREEETKPVMVKQEPEQPVIQDTSAKETQPVLTPEAPQETTYMTQLPQIPETLPTAQNVPSTEEPDDDDADEPDDRDEPDLQAPTTSGRPENPTSPTTPSKPENTTNPINPTSPTTPSKPEDPTNPTNPTDPTTPSKPENPTNPTDPTTPSKPEDPTNPTGPDTQQKCRVTFYRTYVALWSEEDGKIYSYVKKEDAITHTEAEAVKGTLLQKPSDLTITMTPSGWDPLRAGFVFTGWCTKDSVEWDFEKDTVTEDMELYPVWTDADGHKYYPVFYSDESGDYPCNNIIENSEPKGEK